MSSINNYESFSFLLKATSWPPSHFQSFRLECILQKCFSCLCSTAVCDSKLQKEPPHALGWFPRLTLVGPARCQPRSSSLSLTILAAHKFPTWPWNALSLTWGRTVCFDQAASSYIKIKSALKRFCSGSSNEMASSPCLFTRSSAPICALSWTSRWPFSKTMPWSTARN